MSERIWTAGLVVIGDEILSGRTHDKNIAQVAEWLQVQGIRLDEVRVVPDVEERIVEAVNALRARNDYLFTTGGIGPTHDDITVDAVAAALDVDVVVHPEARALLERYYADKPGGLTEDRLRLPGGLPEPRRGGCAEAGGHLLLTESGRRCCAEAVLRRGVRHRRLCLLHEGRGHLLPGGRRREHERLDWRRVRRIAPLPREELGGRGTRPRTVHSIDRTAVVAKH